MCWKTPPRRLVPWVPHSTPTFQCKSSPICPGNGGNDQSLSTYHSHIFICIHDSCKQNPSLFRHCLAICDMFFVSSPSLYLSKTLWCHSTKQSSHDRSTLAGAAGRGVAMSTMFVFAMFFFATDLGDLFLGTFMGHRHGNCRDAMWCWIHGCFAFGDDLMTCMSRS